MTGTKDFTWSLKEHTMRDVLDNVSPRFPVIVRLTQGYMGQDERMHTFSLHETYWLQGIHTQRRVLMKTDNGKPYSFPLDFDRKFKLVSTEKSTEKPLQVIVEDWKKTGESMVLELPSGGIPVFAGLDSTVNMTLGRLQLEDVYDERYLIGHSMIDGVPYESPTLIPAYVNLLFEEATGFAGDNKGVFLEYIQDTTEKVNMFKYPASSICVNKTVMMYNEELNTREYEYIVPTLAKPERRPPKHSTPSRTYYTASYKKSDQNTYACIDSETPKHGTGTVHNTKENTYEYVTHKHESKPKAPPKPSTGPKPLAKKKPMHVPVPEPNVVSTSNTNSFYHPGSAPEAPGAPMNIYDQVEFAHEAQPGVQTSKDEEQSVVRSTTDKAQSVEQFASVIQPSGQSNADNLENPYKEEKIYASLNEVPKDINTFTMSEVSDVLRLLKLDRYIDDFLDNDIDGELLKCLDKDVLKDDFNMTQFEAIKIMKFIGGWRPT